MARILLADDDGATRDLVKRALGTDGHTVTSTQDGTEALDAIIATPAGFDLLISDVQMPGLDGIGLAEHALGAAPGLRIILMSGFAGELDRADHLKGKLAKVLIKPFTLDEIRTAVKAALG
jgi:two-component system cell cycle response regulator CpdR